MTSSMAGARLREEELVGAVSADELWRHTEQIARWVRLSGSEEEARALDYVEETLRGFGARVRREAFESLISLPGDATLDVVGPESRAVECNTHSFSPSTPPEGIEGELVYVGRGTPEDYERVDVRGKIALIDGLAMPPVAQAAEDRGALAKVHVAGDQLHEMIITTVWGTPTPETAARVPKTTSVSVRREGGDALKALLERGPVRVRIRAETTTEWRQVPVTIAEIDGPDDRFVMFSGHVDSWHYGAMDNGTANAVMIEVMRLLAERRGELRRGLRLAFWSGHSHGRYSGSAWYADAHWEELYRRCVAHVNVDSVGGQGATVLGEGAAMAELRGLAADVIGGQTGEHFEGARYGRAGDQSFSGIGLPSVFMSLSEQPPDTSATAAAFATLMGGQAKSGGLGWWWHTPDDTIDKIDRDFLLRDARIYAAVVWRLCTEPVLPLDYAAVADELADALGRWQERAGDRFDLGPARDRAAELRARLGELNARAADADEETAETLNRCLVRLGRLLIPIGYTRTGQFDHDLAVATPAIPVLEPIGALARADPATDEYRFLQTRLVRERNKVVHALIEARATVDETLAALP